MPRRNPFEVVLFGGLPIGRESWIPRRERRHFPIGVAFIATYGLRSRRRIERVREGGHRFESERHVGSALTHEARDGLGDEAMLLGSGATLDEHLQIKFL